MRPVGGDDLHVFLLADILLEVDGGMGFLIDLVSHQDHGNIHEGAFLPGEIAPGLVIAAALIGQVIGIAAAAASDQRDRGAADPVSQGQRSDLDTAAVPVFLLSHTMIQYSLDGQNAVSADLLCAADLIIIRMRQDRMICSVQVIDGLCRKPRLIDIILVGDGDQLCFCLLIAIVPVAGTAALAGIDDHGDMIFLCHACNVCAWSARLDEDMRLHGLGKDRADAVFQERAFLIGADYESVVIACIHEFYSPTALLYLDIH